MRLPTLGECISELPTLGQRIRAARHSLALRQIDLATLSGLSRQTIIQYEWDRVRPYLEHVLTIASVLGVRYEELINNGKAGDRMAAQKKVVKKATKKKAR